MDTAEIFSRLRISAPNRAISSEWAPRSWKKLSSIETRSIFMISVSAPASACSVAVLGATYLLLEIVRRDPLGAGRFLRSALLFDVIGITDSSSRYPGTMYGGRLLRRISDISLVDTSGAPCLRV